jgi:cyanophycin synthetase
VGHVVRQTGRVVGMTTTGGVWIGDDCIVRGDTTGPASARAVLSDPSVEVAVLETARGGIVRRGLGYDWSDVGVITNVRADHLGQDGMETIDDIVHAKALVAERVRDGGTVVVNADDEGALKVLEQPAVQRGNKRIVYFSTDPDNPVIRRHLAAGGTAYFVRAGRIVEASGAAEIEIVAAADCPITFGGLAEFQVENCLAVVATTRALNVPIVEVAHALQRFDNVTDNVGRTNLYRLGRGYVLLDYGHNPDAFEAVGRFVRRWQPDRPTIGLINVPGDRGDALIREAGRAAARSFPRLVLSEDSDLREREPGEVLGLLREGVEDEGGNVPVSLVPDKAEALRSVLDDVRAGALAVIVFESLEPLLAVLEEAGAESVAQPPPPTHGDGAPALADAGLLVATTSAQVSPTTGQTAPASTSRRLRSSFPFTASQGVGRNGEG